MGRSMTGGGEGASVVEVDASLPARLLGAIKNQSVLKIGMKEKEEKEICFSKNLKEKLILSFSPLGFYRHKIA